MWGSVLREIKDCIGGLNRVCGEEGDGQPKATPTASDNAASKYPREAAISESAKEGMAAGNSSQRTAK